MLPAQQKSSVAEVQAVRRIAYVQRRPIVGREARTTAAAIRKLKDTTRRFLWADSLMPGAPAMLLGYPVTIADDMPQVGAGLLPVAFGDFGEGYTIVDSRAMTVLRDPYSQKPYVLFYTYARVGGGVTDFDAIKVMQVAS